MTTTLNEVTILSYQPKYAEDYKQLNLAWIEKYFKVEEHDIEQLDNPDAYIISKGGYILFAKYNDEIVGSGGYKGKPVDNKIEIAYGTFPAYQRKGIGTAICKALVELAIETDPGLIITARTLPENNYSTKILQKNNFLLLGMIWDEDDGDVWEWQYQK